MEKIVFCNIPMKRSLTSFVYESEYEEINEKVIYPINSVLSKHINKTDSVKVILLSTQDEEENYKHNIKLFKKELEKINEPIGAQIYYEIVESPFDEKKEAIEQQVRNIIAKLDKNCEIYSDITYGPKPLPMVLMCCLNFAEKFFAANIKSIIYGKVEFLPNKDTGCVEPQNPKIYDLSHLYYLFNVMVSMNAKSTEDAVTIIDSIFDF